MKHIKSFNEGKDEKKSHPINKSVCYVAHQGIADLSLMFGDIHALIRWPETGVTLTEKVQGIKYVKPILTEDPWFISCYDKSEVYIWRDGQWKNPDMQTYGASISIIMSRILGVSSTIPINISGVRGDLEEIKGFYNEISKEI